MPRTTESAARRARSAVLAAVSARLATAAGQIDLLGGHVALPDGRLVVFVSRTGAVAACVPDGGSVGGRLVLVDLAPVAVNVRERARVEIAGTLRPADDEDASYAWLRLSGEASGPNDALALELEADVVLLTEGARSTRVDVDAFRAATPDPVAPYEASLLQHLAAAHQGSVAVLAQSASDQDTTVWTSVVPVRITCDALTLRFCGPAGHRDVALPFEQPIEDPRLADRAVAALVHACQVRATFG